MYFDKYSYTRHVRWEFTQLFGVEPHTNSQFCDDTNLARWKDAIAFSRFTFGGEEPDGDDNHPHQFMERITGNYGRPEPVEDILKDYYGLTEEIINTINEALDNC